MELVPYVVAYIAIGIFVVAVLARFFMWAKMPMHVRWELYPVAHEAETRALRRLLPRGSRLVEEAAGDLHARRAQGDDPGDPLPGRAQGAQPEALERSFPFHFGLYLVIGATALMFGAASLGAICARRCRGRLRQLACRYVIMGLRLRRARLWRCSAPLGLLLRRLTDPELKDFTAPATSSTWSSSSSPSACALATFCWSTATSARACFSCYNLVTFKMGARCAAPGPQALLPTATVVLLGAAGGLHPADPHVPLRRQVLRLPRDPLERRRPTSTGSDHEKRRSARCSSYPVSWAAPHIQGDGKKTWADVATEEQKK